MLVLQTCGDGRGEPIFFGRQRDQTAALAASLWHSGLAKDIEDLWERG